MQALRATILYAKKTHQFYNLLFAFPRDIFWLRFFVIRPSIILSVCSGKVFRGGRLLLFAGCFVAAGWRLAGAIGSRQPALADKPGCL